MKEGGGGCPPPPRNSVQVGCCLARGLDLALDQLADLDDLELVRRVDGSMAVLAPAPALRRPDQLSGAGLRIFEGVLQGGNDPRVTLSESEQMVQTVRKNGTPVWYLMAKDEGHGFGKKKNRDFLFYSTVLFIKEYLLK